MASVECLEDGSSTGRPPGGVIGRVARPHTLLGTGLTPNTWMTAQTFLSTARAASPPAIFEGESIQPLSEIDLVRWEGKCRWTNGPDGVRQMDCDK